MADDEKVESGETKKKATKSKKVEMTAEGLASRQQSHAIKVAKSIAGGKP